MGGFLGSPWNFIFLEEFVAAGGARISLNSLCRDMERSHSHTPEIKAERARVGGQSGIHN